MYLPRAAELHVYSDDGDRNAPPGGWSSLIGVVTAIVGNILISFALNTQRYAHLRLSRDRDQQLEEKRKRDRKREQGTSYGTQQAEIAEESAQENARAAPDTYTLDGAAEAGERQPLIPKRKHARSESGSSDDTARSNDDGERSEKEKSYLKSPIWWLGISMMVVGEAGNFLAYGFAPASIVSPLGVVALISNCLIAPLLLGEQFRWRDAAGVCIAVAGCVVVVLSASESNPKLEPDAIWHLITRWEFETYLGITVFMIISLAVASNKFGGKSILIDLGLVALLGGYTALSTKGVSSLLSNKIWRVFTFPITYLLVTVLVFTAVMQIKYINRALQRFNATMVIPTQFVLFTLSVITGSAILYRDFEREQTDDAIKFVAGCALTFFGVWCITSGRNKQRDEESDEEEDDEGIHLADEEQAATDKRVADGKSSACRERGANGRTRSSRTRSANATTTQMTTVDGLAPNASSDHIDLDKQLSRLPPGLATAVHTDSTATMQLQGGSGSQKPPLHATTSAPVVPALPSSTLRPQTTISRTPSTPTTPSDVKQAAAQPNAIPPTTPQYLHPGSAPRLVSRSSMAGLLPMPGRFTSPLLSGSLSAIVADELRRGADGGSVRRKSIRRGNTTQDAAGLILPSGRKRHSIASGEMFLTPDDADTSASAASSRPSGRMRSLSATLGDLFSPSKRQKRPDVQNVVNERSPGPADGDEAADGEQAR